MQCAIDFYIGLLPFVSPVDCIDDGSAPAHLSFSVELGFGLCGGLMISDIVLPWHISYVTITHGCLNNRALIKVFYCQIYPSCFPWPLPASGRSWKILYWIVLSLPR